MLDRKFERNSIANEIVSYDDQNFTVTYFFSSMEEECMNFIPHTHKEFEILFIENGSAEIFCRDKKHIASTGDIFIFGSNELHSSLRAATGYISKCIQFDSKFLASKFFDACENKYIAPVFNNMIIFENKIPNDPELISIFKKIEDEFLYTKYGYEIAIKGHLYSFLSILFRKYAKEIVSDKKRFNHINAERMNYIYDYIAENFSTEINIDVILRELYIDKSYFCRIFKNFTGKSFVDYVNNYRVLQALSLITDSDENISVIASKVGFNDINYFSRIFKKIISISPTEMRRQSQNSKSIKIKKGYIDGKST